MAGRTGWPARNGAYSRGCSRRWQAVAFAGVLLALAAAGGAVAAESVPVPPDTAAVAPPRPVPAIGDTIDAAAVRRWGLFPDIEGIRWVVVLPARWGGYLAHIEVDGPAGRELRLRYLPADLWERWRREMAAGGPVTAMRLPPPPAGAVWPEVPLPPPPPETTPPARTGPPPSLRGRWLLVLEGGWQRSTTRFHDYFTDGGLIILGVGYGVSRRVIPFLDFQVGFGDQDDDFERLAGDGRSDFYAVELGTRLLTPLTDRTSLRLDLAGGYYMRALRWGGDLFVGPDGLYRGASFVREFDDWGGSVALGLQWRIRPGARQPHYLTCGIRYDFFGADPLVLMNPETGEALLADDHDRWLGVTFGLLVGL